MTLATDKKKISAYLPAELKDAAELLAASESRSLSNLIEVLLKDAIETAVNEGKIKIQPEND